MHHTLRSSFKIEKNFEDAEWQFITTDYMYGTYFSIYAKFKYEKNTNIPVKCHLKIQNYQGQTTIGLSKINPDINIYYDKDIGDYVYFFSIHLKGYTANTEICSKINFKKKNKFIKKPETQEIKEFNSKYLMFVDLKYEELHTADDLKDVNSLPFIDTARYLRDGDQLLKLNSTTYIADEENSVLDNNSDFLKILEKMSHSKSFTTEDYNIMSTKIHHGGNGTIVYDEPDNNDGERYKWVKSLPCRNIYVRFIDGKSF